MRTIKLHHTTGNPYWKDGEFKVELPNGQILGFIEPLYHGSNQTWDYKITVEPEGIIYNRYNCSSGGGKRLMPNTRKILIPIQDYDNIEYIGTPLIISQELLDDVNSAIG